MAVAVGEFISFGLPTDAMHFRANNRRCGGFVSVFATELAAATVIYAIYFGLAFPICRKLTGITGLSLWSLALIPIGFCFALSGCWFAFRRYMGHPKAELSLFGTAHLLVLAFSILIPLSLWILTLIRS